MTETTTMTMTKNKSTKKGKRRRRRRQWQWWKNNHKSLPPVRYRSSENILLSLVSYVVLPPIQCIYHSNIPMLRWWRYPCFSRLYMMMLAEKCVYRIMNNEHVECCWALNLLAVVLFGVVSFAFESVRMLGAGFGGSECLFGYFNCIFFPHNISRTCVIVCCWCQCPN